MELMPQLRTMEGMGDFSPMTPPSASLPRGRQTPGRLPSSPCPPPWALPPCSPEGGVVRHHPSGASCLRASSGTLLSATPRLSFLWLGPAPSSNFWSEAGNCWCPTCQEAFPVSLPVFAGLGLELGSGCVLSEAQPCSNAVGKCERTLCQVSVPSLYPHPVSRAP